MNVAVFSAKAYDRQFIADANSSFSHTLRFLDAHLGPETSALAHGFAAVCVFVNDILDKDTLTSLARHGVRLVALRCAGYNNVDLNAAASVGLTVARVPAYAPHGVAEHAVGLILTLNRKIHRAYNRVHEGNFSLDGLLGFEIHGRTVGVMGTGKIGSIVARIMTGFGARVVAYDPFPNKECLELGVTYVEPEELYRRSDIISLHLPLTKASRHIINPAAIALMKKGVMLVNTSRGGLIDTLSVIEALKSGQIGYLGLDVYEEEGDMFFEDRSGDIIHDDAFARLLTFPNVVVTGHQAFFTREALHNIAQTTLQNITDFEQGCLPKENRVA